MKNRIFIVLVYTAAVFALTACKEAPVTPSRTSNQSTIHAVSVTIDFSESKIVEPGYIWRDNSGIEHIQGRVTAGEIFQGDLVGKIVRAVIKDARINPGTGTGKIFLEAECDLNWPNQNLSGTFTGELTQHLTAFKITSATLDAHGGDKGFSDLQLSLNLEEIESGSEVLRGNGRITESGRGE